MSRAVIRRILECSLREFSTAHGLDVAAENRVFAPKRTPYLETSLMISDEGAAALGADAPEKSVGILQVTIVTAANESAHVADELAGALKDHFGRRRLREDGASIVITRVRSVKGVSSAKTYTLPVSVEFRADTDFNPAR